MSRYILSTVIFLTAFAFSSAHAAGDEIELSLCGGSPEKLEFIVKNERTLLRFFNTESGKVIVTKLEEDVLHSANLEGALADEVYEYMALEYGATLTLRYGISAGNKQTGKPSQTYIVVDSDLDVFLLLKDDSGLTTLGSKLQCKEDEERKKASPGYIRDDLG
ncbi:hypothetical protein [Bdellovibrio sp. HCB209]|uniref:hypothetical protein n=1 Tax=Bdellovibrio sp. HCB209 TaxID=3394354 RepID=UPI0039B42574